MSEEIQTIVRSRRCGLRDIHLAKVTQNDTGGYKAATPVKFARALKATISDTYASEKVYSDDGTEEIVNSYQGTTISLEVNTLAPADRALLWARLHENGYLVESAEDTPPELALGFRVRQLNGKYEFVWYYCGKFDQGNEEEYETIGESKVHKTATISASFYERAKSDLLPGADGKNEEKHQFRIRVDESNLLETNTTAAEAIKNWFGQVQEYNSTSSGAEAETEQTDQTDQTGA